MKNRFFVFTALTVFVLTTFMSCSGTPHERISLGDGWEYRVQDSSETAFKPLESGYLANLEKLVPDGQGYIWLKKRFSIPQSLKNRLLGCYLGRIAIADETFFNGTQIGGEGLFPPDEFSAWNRARFYPVPETLVRDGENEIRIKIWVDGEGSIVSNPFIGEISDAKESAKREAFWASEIQFVFAVLMLVIAVYHILMYFKSRTEKYNLAFGLVNLISAIYLCVFYYAEFPGFTGKGISFLWFQKIFSSGIPYLLPFLVTTYINSFIKRRERVPMLVLRIIFAVAPIAVVLWCPTYTMLHKIQQPLQAMLIPPMVYILIILVGNAIHKKKESLVLLLGFSPLVLAVLLDFLVHSVFKVYDFPYISSIGWQLVIISLLFIMARRFVNSKLEVEYLNRNLEKEVSDRTRELSESNEQLSLTNTELSDAKKRMDRDMQLAVYVQRSFYQRSAPDFSDWEIAYHFNPMAGVSGDLYDFFYKHDTLHGVGLFDVSGHGIASGLVTMLAKTVIDRKFYEGLEKPLPHVMEEINRQICEEKGDVENYLTGVLLRMNGNRVEYLSAGHPKAFFRSGATGRTVPIEIAGKDDGSGGLIGIPMLEPTYSAIGFSMKSGDSVVLYTDCLSESKNRAGKEFGYDGITGAFSKSSGSAGEQLDFILSEFSKFTSGVPANDDLTIIVIRKK